MRIIRSEFGADYPAYAFGYTIHAELESGDVPIEAYEAGFLPASSDPAVHNRCYMARSVRVPLPQAIASSENRRILKKFDGQFTGEIVVRDALAQDVAFASCFLSYFADRHGQGVMSQERLQGILATMLPLRGVRYLKDGAPIAHVLEIVDGSLAHYWFSCHDMSYAGSGLGMWLMLDAVRRAQAEGRAHLYLGTAYGKKGRYKMNIQPLEFWDGATWRNDARALKARIATDPE